MATIDTTLATGSNDKYQLIVYHAARDGNLKRLHVFLDTRTREENSPLLNVRTFNTPPLVIASRNNHVHVVQYLLEKGAEIGMTGEVKFDGETIDAAPCIWAAAAAGHLQVVQALVEHGADVNQTTTTNSSAVRGACFDGHIHIVRYLVNHGADIEIANRHGHTPLMIAAYRNKLDIVRFLLESHAHVNRRRNTCLHDAAEAGSVRIVKELLAAGALVQRDGHGMTPMLSAALIGHRDVVEYFAECQLGIGEEEEEGDDDDFSDDDDDMTDVEEAQEDMKRTSISSPEPVDSGVALVENDAGTSRGSPSPTFVDAAVPSSSSTSTTICRPKRRLTRLERKALQHDIACGLHERANSLKLLGATCIDKRRDISSALKYWKRAVALQQQCTRQECADKLKDEESKSDKPSRRTAYGCTVEVSTVAEVNELVGDSDASQMQALLMRERILGAKHPETFYYLRYRGAIHADQGRYDRCFELWMYALGLQQKALAPLNVMTLISISAFVEIFGYMINDYLLAVADGSMSQTSVQIGVDVPSFEHMTEVLRCCVHEVYRHKIGDMPPSLAEDDAHLAMCEDCAPREPTVGLHRLSVSAIQLTALIGRLDVTAKPTNEQTAGVLAILKRMVGMLPQIGKSKQTMMHLACADSLDHQDSSSAARNGADIRLPSLYVVRSLLSVGVPFDERDKDGRTPLHIATANTHHRRWVINSLLDAGAHIDNRANDGQTPMEMLRLRAERNKNENDPTEEVNNATFRPVNPMRFRDLKCLAAEAVAKFDRLHDTNIECLPEVMRRLVNTH